MGAIISTVRRRRPAPGSGVPEPLRALTVREQAVLRALAQGRSDAEIAGALFLGEATVKTHVTSVLQKLGLRDRLQAVVLAYECGFVEPRRSVDGASSQAGRSGAPPFVKRDSAQDSAP